MTRNEIETSLNITKGIIEFPSFVEEMLKNTATHLHHELVLVRTTTDTALAKLQHITEEELEQFSLVMHQMRDMAMDICQKVGNLLVSRFDIS